VALRLDTHYCTPNLLRNKLEHISGHVVRTAIVPQVLNPTVKVFSKRPELLHKGFKPLSGDRLLLYPWLECIAKLREGIDLLLHPVNL